MKAKRLLFLVMVICLASGVKAQFDSDEVYYYVPTETIITEDTEVYVMFFSGNRAAVQSNKCAIILNESTSYWKSKLQSYKPSWCYTYDSSLSTNSTLIYKLEVNEPRYNGSSWSSTPGGYRYLSISKDKSYAEKWLEKPGKKYKSDDIHYKLVSRDNIVPRQSTQYSTNGYSGSTSYNGGGYSGGGYGSSNSSSSSSSSSSIPRPKCPNCTNGRRVYEGTVGYSGTQIRYATCSECGKRYMSSHTTHRHDRCTTCHGKGYLD